MNPAPCRTALSFCSCRLDYGKFTERKDSAGNHAPPYFLGCNQHPSGAYSPGHVPPASCLTPQMKRPERPPPLVLSGRRRTNLPRLKQPEPPHLNPASDYGKFTENRSHRAVPFHPFTSNNGAGFSPEDARRAFRNSRSGITGRNERKTPVLTSNPRRFLSVIFP